MKKLLILLFATVLCACSDKYDDRLLTERVDHLENRIARLEELCKQMNADISSLQTLVTALQNNDYVTGVVPVTKNGETVGYTISFTKSSPITIYHGADGKDGIDGTNGKDGRTPVIGVRQDSDGLYYWTLDGDWLLDGSGNKIRAEGRDGKDGENGSDGKDGAPGADGQDGAPGTPGADGKDGITPQLKIEEGYWYVSTDGGATWTNLGKATGEDGKDGSDAECEGSFFRDVDTSDSEQVVFTLADGTTLSLPKYRALTITFTEGDELFFDIDETLTVHYTIAGSGSKYVVKAEMQNLDGSYTLRTTPTSVTQGTIAITAAIPTANNVIVSVSDGKQTIMAAIAVTFKPEVHIITVETPGTLSQLLVRWNKEAITELTITGNLDASDIVMLNNLPNLTTLNINDVYLTELPDNAFEGNTSLTSVVLPRTLKTIGNNAFYECANLSNINIPNGTTTIGKYAFACCWVLTDITIPESVTTISEGAFTSCNCLTNIIIPKNVTIIKTWTFTNCSSLKSVSIPENVTTIEEYAFSSDSYLEYVYCKAQTPPILEEKAFPTSSWQHITLYVPINSKAIYEADNEWSRYFTTIEEIEF